MSPTNSANAGRSSLDSWTRPKPMCSPSWHSQYRTEPSYTLRTPLTCPPRMTEAVTQDRSESWKSVRTRIVFRTMNSHGELRRATAAVHEALHSLPVFDKLLTRSMSRQNYVDMLIRLYGFYISFDAAVWRGLQTNVLQIGFESRSPMLAEDLRCVGYCIIDDLPKCKILSLSSPAEVAGALYVAEGAALGGGVMRKALLRNPAIGAVSSGGYWTWCAEVGAPGWKNTLSALLAEAPDREKLGEMIASANRIFESFRRWFERSDEPVA